MFKSLAQRSFSVSTKNMGKLDGKVAVVTASTKGIGFAIAKKLASDGAKVVISSRKEANVEKAVGQLKEMSLDVTGLQCHVSKQSDRTNLVNEIKSKFGKLDILVSNAAVNPYFGPTLETPEMAYDKIMDVNVKSTFLLVKDFAPLLKSSSNPSITIVSSIGGFVPFEALGIYSISKTALLGLTKVLANELARDKIRVNCLCPGVVKTDFSQVLWQGGSVSDQIRDEIPLKRFAEPDDCSGIVSFLASDEATYITGENFVVAGGWQSRL